MLPYYTLEVNFVTFKLIKFVIRFVWIIFPLILNIVKIPRFLPQNNINKNLNCRALMTNV